MKQEREAQERFRTGKYNATHAADRRAPSGGASLLVQCALPGPLSSLRNMTFQPANVFSRIRAAARRA